MTELVLDHVTKTIKGHTVIDDVSLQFEPGAITGLRGVNGSGKTMLMRLIAGLIRPTSGTVSIGGKTLWKDLSFPPSIGLLIENPAFLDQYSGFLNLKLLASLNNRISEEQIKETIRQVGLDPEDQKKYKKYSLGMKQRLGIAAALMEKTDLILLDEPTNALDEDGIALLKELLQTEKKRGATVVLSCHDLGVLKELSDTIYLIKEGRAASYVPEASTEAAP